MNTQQPDSVDSILNKFGIWYCYGSPTSETDMAQAKSELLALLMGVIGKDENPDEWHVSAVGEKRNELRAEQRQAIQRLFGSQS